MIAIFSFFAGAGFLDLGFENTNHEIVFVNEYKNSFLEAYKYSRNILGLNEPRFGYSSDDISVFLKSENLNTIIIQIQELRREGYIIGIIGGPPCPDFSVGGKNKGRHGDNGQLTEIYFRLIASLQPDFFLFENVKGLFKTKRHRAFYDEMKGYINYNGYKTYDKLINTLVFGVPQDRERIFMIGFLKDFLNGRNFVFQFNERYNINYIKEKDWPVTNDFVENGELEMPGNIIPELTVNFWFNMNNVREHPNASNYFHPRNGLAKFLTIREGDVLKKSYKRLHRWRYSPTVAYGNNEVHLHPFHARRLSVAEALSLQTLPPNFSFPSKTSLTDMFKMIGNGVPYIASLNIASLIRNFIIN